MLRKLEPPFADTVSGRIDSRLYALGLTERQASLKAGVSDSFLRNIRKGKSQSPQADNMTALAALLGTSVEWILHGTGDAEAAAQLAPSAARSVAAAEPRPRDRRRIPLFGVVQGASWSPDGPGVAFERRPLDWFDAPPALEYVDDAFALRVKGDSMAPLHPHGALRFIHPQRDIRVGDAVVVVTQNRPGGPLQATIKTLVKYIDNEGLRVSQLNPPATIDIPGAVIAAGPFLVLDVEGMVR
jgi:phage repressor protein C with HTH and peptisase S24 domain